MSSRMKFLAVSTALVAAGGLAWLTSASAFDGGFESGPQVAQAAPPPPPPGAAPGAGPAAPMAAPKFNPRNMCLDRVAHRIGNRAYLKARLDLKPEQTNAWNAFEKAADDASAKDKARCAALPTEVTTPPKFNERMTMRETRMKARMESFEAVKPSLTALYAALTPEQQALFDRPMMGGHRHHGWRGRHGRG
ncbi:MAG: Spy/CpxP family protein refolding chaperone [Proteobacteria bacterium]|nr:Spy/CpxP family protein refolding chaperone [Pseudomonadota bacterium]